MSGAEKKCPQKDLLCMNWDDGLVHSKGKLVCIYRSREEPVGPNFQEYVHVAEFNKNMIQSSQIALQEVFLPMMPTDCCIWGDCTEDERQYLLKSMKIIVASLSEASRSIKGGLELHRMDYKPDEAAKNKSDENAVKADFVVACERLVEIWVDQIEEVLQDLARKDEEDSGPDVEMEFWRRRNHNLQLISEQLKSKELRNILVNLNYTKGKLVKKWKALDAKLTDALNEAKDNVKYLSVIENFTEPLYSGSQWQQVNDCIPNIMNNIKIMVQISRSYNTGDRVTTLLVKMCNQIIKAASRIISAPGLIWDQPYAELQSNLECGIKTCELFRDQYKMLVSKVAHQGKGKSPEINEGSVFARLDLLCRRLGKLQSLFTTIQQFSLLSRQNVDGMNGIVQLFHKAKSSFRERKYNLLDLSKTTFDRDFIDFNAAVSELEGDIQFFIDQSFEGITSAEHALQMLHTFESIIQRDSLKSDLESKYAIIFHKYGQDLAQVQQIYESQKSSPPFPRNIPPVAGNIMWSQLLLRRIEEPMVMFKDNPLIQNNIEARDIIKTYNRVARALIQFEHLWHEAWLKAVDNAKTGLLATLLVESPFENKLYVNFDPEIMQLIREAKSLQRMNIEIPESASVILQQEEKFKYYYYQLSFAVDEYSRICEKVVAVTRSILTPHLDDLLQIFGPGLHILTWQSMNIDGYLSRLHNGLHKFEDLVDKINEIIDNRISANVKKISRMIFVTLPADASFTLEQFVSLQDKSIREKSEELITKNKLVERAVQDIIPLLHRYQFDGAPPLIDKDDIDNFVDHFADKMYVAILSATKNSFIALKKRLGSRVTGGFLFVERPFFDVDVELSVPNVTMSPSLEEIQTAINQCALLVIWCLKDVFVWTDSSHQKQHSQKKSFYEEVAKDKVLVKVVLLLTGSIDGSKRQVLEYLQAFRKYDYLWKDDKAHAFTSFLKGHPNLSNFEEQIRKYFTIEKEISDIAPVHNIGCMSLETASLKNSLKSEASAWKNMFGKSLHSRARDLLDELHEKMGQFEDKLSIKVLSFESLKLAWHNIKEMRDKDHEIEVMINPVEDHFEVLRKFGVRVPSEEEDAVLLLRKKWVKVGKMCISLQQDLNFVQSSLKNELQLSVKQFHGTCREFRSEYESTGPCDPHMRHAEAIVCLKKFQEKIDVHMDKIAELNLGERIFNLAPTTFPEIQAVAKSLEMIGFLHQFYHNTHQMLSAFSETVWSDVVQNVQIIMLKLTEADQTRSLVAPALKSWPAFVEVSLELSAYMNASAILPLISSKAIRSRHWTLLSAFSQDFGIPFQMQQDSVVLRNVLSLQLHLNLTEVQNIHDNAVEELNIEKQLNDVIEEWNDEHLVFAEYRGDKKILLQPAQVSDFLLRLEDSQTNLQKLSMSIHSLPFKDDLESWILKLSSVHEILEKWLAAQSLWLEAAFCMHDVAKKLPTEAKRFHAVDKNYLKTMKKVCEVTSVIQCCGSDWVQNFLPVVMSQLQLVFKSMSNYLDQKRSIFPKFYFVSDHCILDLMANTRDSELLQYNMQLVFPGCSRMLLEEQPNNCYSIVGIVTTGGETVLFGSQIMITGQLEDWLTKTLHEMQESLKSALANAMDESASTHISEYASQVHMQVGVVALQAIWTREVQDAILKSKVDKTAIGLASKKVAATYQSLVRLRQLRQTSWSGSQMKALEMYVATQSYLKDAIEEVIRKKVTQIGDFDWQRLGRMYWSEEDRSCKASIGCKDFRYSFEYLKAEGRIFVFAHTERAYYRMIQTLASANGTLLLGQAETGKTETIKSLACFLGKMVQCIDCALNLDFQTISKSNIGIASSGCWGCYKNIDSMSQSILSLFVQNVQCVLSALREKKDQIVFTDGEIVQVDPRCGYFVVTSKMPSNFRMTTYLKSCFRSYCFCEPDIDALLKIKFVTMGADDAGTLSRKLGLVLKSMRDIFGKMSAQSFGLRSLLVLLKKFELLMNAGSSTELGSLHAALLQVYAPKFDEHQLSIFQSLLQDVIGTVPDHQDTIMDAFIVKILKENYGIQSNSELNKKVCYLIDALQTSHNTMLVGETGVGKTLAFEVALSYISSLNSETKHSVSRIYPNAISQEILFGGTESKDHGTPGILVSILKRASSSRYSQTCQWIVMDGPTKGLWIDMIHIFLEKNKFQTGVSDHQNRSVQLVVETDSIKFASPSSVSIFNIIHASDASINHLSIFDKWIANNGPSFVIDSLSNLSKSYFTTLHGIIERECKFITEVCIWSTMSAMTSLLQNFIDAAKNGHFNLDGPSINRIYMFSFAWAFGASLDDSGRAKIHSALVTHARLSLPSEGTIFDFILDSTSFTFHPVQKYVAEWNSGLLRLNDNSAKFIVPTPDFVRYQMLSSLFLKSGKSTLFIGLQRCGKTTLLDNFKDRLSIQNYQVKSMFFESHQTASVVQSLITNSLVRKPGKILAPSGDQTCVYFVDDLYFLRERENEKHADESPAEFLRQILGDGGFWATEASVTSEWTAIKNVRFVGAAPFPTGSDAKISARNTRYFQIIHLTELNSEAVVSVFSASLAEHFSTCKNSKADVLILVPGLIKRTIVLLDHLKIVELNGNAGGSSPIKVTGKRHDYIHVISNVVRGIQMCDAQDVVSWIYLLELWKNECMRVLTDGMSSQRDVAVVEKAIMTNANMMNNPDLYKMQPSTTAKPQKKKDAASEFKYNDKLIVRFGCLCNSAKKYEIIKSSGKLLSQIEEIVSAYDASNPDDPMQFMIFDFAVDHLLRVCRAIAHQNNPIALVGKVYTGKRTLVKLASFIMGHKMLQFGLNEDRNLESWKHAFRVTGLENAKITGLIHENCLASAKLASQISTFFRITEIPDLFTKDECNSIIGDLRAAFKRQHPTAEELGSNIWSFFLARVKCNLHLVFFINRAHDDDVGFYDEKYPGIFSAVTRIFVREWPSVALKSVASKLLGPVKLTVDDDTKLRLIVCLAGIHADMSSCTGEYEALKGQRIESTSSKTFMSFMNYYLSIFEKKKTHITARHAQIEKTLACLNETEQRATILAKETETRDESLSQIHVDVTKILSQIGGLTAIAEKNKQQLQASTQNYNDALKQLETDRKNCDDKLASAAPILEEAERCLLSLTPKDFVTLKTFKNPPSVIKLIFDTVLLLFHSPLQKVEVIERDGKKFFQDSWPSAFALLKRDNFVDSLRHFKKEAINAETIELMQPYIDHDDFLYSKARKASAVAAGVFSWVHAMLSYYSAASNVRSKIDGLQAATANFDVMQKRQMTLQLALEDSQLYLSQLQKEFEEVTLRRANIILQSSLTKKRLENASKLIETLASIRARWQETSSRFESASCQIVGDAVVAAATLNYCSPFNQEYRSFLLRDKVYRNLEINNIPFSHNFSLVSLIDSNDIDRWHAEGLTQDDLATENAIILNCSTKRVFVIDPEEQFLQWITGQKQTARDSVHVVHSPSCKDLPRIFENCVTSGQKLLLQDPHLDDSAMNLVQSLLDPSPDKFSIRINDKSVNMDSNFVIYCHTTDYFSHQVLKPSLYSDMTVINFSISLESFEHQMLDVILKRERPDCTESIKSFRQLLKTLDGSMKQIESDTLKLLSESQGNIIENDTLLESLLDNQSKSFANSQKKKSTTEQLLRIGQAAEEYRPVATRAAILFFCIRNMAKVDHMYSTTLNEFMRVYDTNTCFSDAASLTSKRLSLLINISSQTVLLHYTKGYTEAHSNLLAMSVALKYGIVSGLCEPVAIQFLVHGGSQLDLEAIPKKTKEWIPDSVWKNAVALSRVCSSFQKLPELLASSQDVFWKALFDHDEPELQEIVPLNLITGSSENEAWMKLLFIRAFREDRAIASSKHFIKTILGATFKDMIADSSDLESLVDSPLSSWSVPNICIFQISGHNSTNDFIMQISALSKRRRMDIKIVALASESDSTIRLLPKLMTTKMWLVLQNAHICTHILSEIYNLLQNCETAHPEFRLWLTTESTVSFPIALLQSSLKFRSKDQDPTIGGTIIQLYNEIGQQMYDSVALPAWRQTIYSLAFFHSLIVGRQKYGFAGWNMQYQFSNSEFHSTLSFAQAMFAEAELRKTKECINFHALRAVITINYGGRITDSNDALVLKTLSEKYISNMSESSALFSKQYRQPAWASTDYVQARHHAVGLPAYDKCEAFGFYQNAEFSHFTTAFQDMAMFLKKVVGLEADSVQAFCAQLKVGATDYRPVSRSALSFESASSVEQVRDSCSEFLTLIPPCIDKSVLQIRTSAYIKANGGKSHFIFAFFLHELTLIENVYSSTNALLDRILRCILSSGYKFNAAHDEDSDNQIKRDISRIYRNITPETFQTLAFPFVTNMRAWFDRLRKAGEQINQFLFRSKPRCIWLGGINSPKGLLTAFRIENAIKKGWSLEETIISVELSRYDNETQIKDKDIPMEIMYISGCSLEGATWSAKEGRLMELSPRCPQSFCPVISVCAAHSRCACMTLFLFVFAESLQLNHPAVP